jgi:hypothetical protein
VNDYCSTWANEVKEIWIVNIKGRLVELILKRLMRVLVEERGMVNARRHKVNATLKSRSMSDIFRGNCLEQDYEVVIVGRA